MFSIFTLAIKLDCLFLTINQRFHLFVGLIFDKLAPPGHMFQKMFKSLSSPLQCIKQSQSAKNVVFCTFCILVDMLTGRGAIAPPWLRYWLKTWYYPTVILHFGRQFISPPPPPLNKRFKLCFKAFFSLIQCKRES